MSENGQDEYFEDRLIPTQLEVSIATANINRGAPFGVDEFEKVMDLIEEHGFWISDESYNVTILTGAFVTTEENMKSVKQIKSTLEDWYPDQEVRAIVSSSNHHAGENFFTHVQMITIENS